MRCVLLPGIPAILALASFWSQWACAPDARTLDRLGQEVRDLSRRVAVQQRTIEDLSTKLAAAARYEAERPGGVTGQDRVPMTKSSPPLQPAAVATVQPSTTAALPLQPATAAPPLQPATAAPPLQPASAALPLRSATRAPPRRPRAAARAAAAPDQPEDPAAAHRRRRLPVVKVRDEDAQAQGGSPASGGGRSGKPEVLRLTGAPPMPAVGPGRAGQAPTGPAASRSAGFDPAHYGSGDQLGVVPLPDAPAEPPRAVGPEADLRAAQVLLAGGRLGEAGRAFSRLAKTHPNHALADDASYGLAECSLREGQPRRAAWVLRGLLRRYPSGNKAPAAMLLLALCEERLGRPAQAKKVLARVQELYPKSPEAARAARRSSGQR